MLGRIPRAVRNVWVSLGVVLLVLVLAESVIRVAYALRDRGRQRAGVVSEDRLATANPDQTWVREYLRELSDVLQEDRLDWHSYVYWRSRPHQGQYINLDEKGIRRTWNLASPSSNQLKIFMFGGSTMWGYGARDDFTIPSLVSKKFSSQLTYGVWVVNFGEIGYVSTQEVIALIQELRRGNVPDIVVFYDNVNDAWAAIQSGVAGIPQNEFNRVAEFNQRNRLNLRSGFVEKLALYRLSRGIVGSFAESPSEASGRRSLLPPPLVNAVVDTYLGNIRLVTALAREYGFRAVFYWQPTIYTKENLSKSEQRWYVQSRERVEEYKALNEAMKKKIEFGKFANVYDLSELFEDDERTIYVDRFHVSEVGNDKIANAIARTLLGVQGLKK